MLRAPQRLQHVEILLAGNGEDVFDALVLERCHQQIGSLCHAAETPLAPGLSFLGPVRQSPVRPNEVTGVAVRKLLQIILMLRLGLPERSGGRHLGDNLAWPEAGSIDIRDGVFRDPLLLVAGIENGRAVARAPVVALAVQRRGIVDLEKEFQQLAIADGLRIESDLNGLGVIAVVAIGRVWHLAAGVAHPGRDHAGIPAHQILHTPEAAAGKDGSFRRNCHVCSPWFAAVVGFEALSRTHNEAERCKSAKTGEPLVPDAVSLILATLTGTVGRRCVHRT